MDEFKGSSTALVAECDCTVHKQLCAKHGIKVSRAVRTRLISAQGYPTLKHGDPNSMEDYKGGRDAAALKVPPLSTKPTADVL